MTNSAIRTQTHYLTSTCNAPKPAERHSSLHNWLELMSVIRGYIHSCLKWFALLSCHLALREAWLPFQTPTEWKHNALVGLYS